MSESADQQLVPPVDEVQRTRELNARTRKNCRTLYPGGKPGWECGAGWTDALAKLSCKIECANRFFMRNFRVHVEADQVKEKFGRLRFYYTVRRDAPPAVKWLCGLIKSSVDAILHKADFKMKSVTVEPASMTIKCRELPPDSGLDRGLSYGEKILEAPDGFRCAFNIAHRLEITKRVPTRLRLLWRATYVCRKAESWLSGLYSVDLNRQDVGAAALDDIVEKAVDETEDECYSVCEKCGRPIGDDYLPRCETLGWTTYVCEQCARSQGGKYRKNGGLYENGEFVGRAKAPEGEGRQA